MVDRVLYRTERFGGIGIFLADGEITFVIIGPDTDIARCLFVLTGLLVGGVIALDLILPPLLTDNIFPLSPQV